MLRQAAQIVARADCFIVTAGAGMGVDSGLPDFRGNRGFWKAYPPYERLGLSFAQAATPSHFHDDPAFGWGFYGHRCNLYRATVPHEGFRIIRRWIERRGAPYFVVTSNVDGQFQKAGYAEERILEVHGSIHHLQCLTPCGDRIWPNRESFSIDTESMRSRTVPHCPACGGTSRPNILMFGDWSWLERRTREQEERFDRFLEGIGERRVAIIEMGAGTSIPTIRSLSVRLGRSHPHATVLRINPREAEIGAPHLSLPYGALECLQRIDRLLEG